MFTKNLLPLLIVSITFALVGCGDDDNATMITLPPQPVKVTYQVTITNLTHSQPLSPIAIALHDSGNLWTLGEPASTALETLAEGGDNGSVLALDIVTASTSGSAPIGPGATETLTVSIEDNVDSMISIVSMLVNTNDGFTGLNGLSLADLAVGDTWMGVSSVYDAGTESNTELAGSIPGPVDGGTGFDATRDDVDFVAMHAGVVSQDDGLTGSVLTQAHRFDNPAMKITITRTE